MKGLKTLIRLKNKELDSLRLSLVEQQEKRALLELAERNLQKELDDELELAAQQPDMAGFFGGFAAGIKQRQAVVREGMRQVDKLIDALRDKITDAFAELKRYEITLENQIKALEKKREKLAGQQLDETSLQQHRRRAVENEEQDGTVG